MPSVARERGFFRICATQLQRPAPPVTFDGDRVVVAPGAALAVALALAI